MYTWFWLADTCADEGIPFVLGHAGYMRMIHGAKAKNDRIDSEKIARLLAANMIPESYAYPSGMRETRSLLRRRMSLVQTRAKHLSHLRCIRQQYNLDPFGKDIGKKIHREHVLAAYPEGDIAKLAEVDLSVVDLYEPVILDLERYIENKAMVTDPATLTLLRSVPGIGKILGLVMMYEIHDITRFENEKQFCSYARLIGCQAESGGKKLGVKGRKIGNAYLKWAFSDAAMLFFRGNKIAEPFRTRMENKHGKARTLSITAHRLGVAVYYMLRNRQVFDIYRFLGLQQPTGTRKVKRQSAQKSIPEVKGAIMTPVS
jgi:transposase